MGYASHIIWLLFSSSKPVLLYASVLPAQTALANQPGIHKNVLGRYEYNEVQPSIEIARKIADILDVSLDYLIGKVDVEMDKSTRKRILEVFKIC